MTTRKNRTTTMKALQTLGRALTPWTATPTPAQQMLGVLNMRPETMYAGTVSAKTKAKRRAANKVARASRRANR